MYIIQKQSPTGVSRRRCSENMQQIYRRTPMSKCDFSKVALQLYWNHISVWVFSCHFAGYFQNTFSEEHFWVAASDNSTVMFFNILLFCLKGYSETLTCFNKGRGKCIQHLIQHRKFCMLDEMLDAFERRQILRKMKKEVKNLVGWCWMKFKLG